MLWARLPSAQIFHPVPSWMIVINQKRDGTAYRKLTRVFHHAAQGVDGNPALDVPPSEHNH